MGGSAPAGGPERPSREQTGAQQRRAHHACAGKQDRGRLRERTRPLRALQQRACGPAPPPERRMHRADRDGARRRPARRTQSDRGAGGGGASGRGVASWRVGLAVEAVCTFWCAWIPRWMAPWVGRAGLWCRALRPMLFGSNVCSDRTSFLRPGVLGRCVSGWLCSSSNRCGVKVCFICVPMGTGVCPWVSGSKLRSKSSLSAVHRDGLIENELSRGLSCSLHYKKFLCALVASVPCTSTLRIWK